jgi:hypothetical protein
VKHEVATSAKGKTYLGGSKHCECNNSAQRLMFDGFDGDFVDTKHMHDPCTHGVVDAYGQ